MKCIFFRVFRAFRGYNFVIYVIMLNVGNKRFKSPGIPYRG